LFLQAAIRDPNPVIFLENELLYGVPFPLSDEAQSPDFTLEIGKANVEKEGTDVTIVAFSKMVGYSLEAAKILAEQHDLNVEVINLRSIRPLDIPAIVKSVKKTNRLVTVEEGWPQHGVGSEICAAMMETEAFDYLDAPVARVTGADVPMPYSVILEACALPQIENIVSAVLRTTARTL